MFSAMAVGQKPITYAWRRDGEDLSDEPNHISGAESPMLTLVNLDADDEGAYTCVITNDCGSVTSAAATLTLCEADFNCDGVLNSADFFSFLTAFFNDVPSADYNSDGSINSQDFFDFLGAFFAACG
jgi:hypothetical protein